MSCNGLQSGIPHWIGGMTSLKKLNVSSCSLTDLPERYVHHITLFKNRSLSKLQTPFTTLTEQNFSQKNLPWPGSRTSLGVGGQLTIEISQTLRVPQCTYPNGFISCVSVFTDCKNGLSVECRIDVYQDGVKTAILLYKPCSPQGSSQLNAVFTNEMSLIRRNLISLNALTCI